MQIRSNRYANMGGKFKGIKLIQTTIGNQGMLRGGKKSYSGKNKSIGYLMPSDHLWKKIFITYVIYVTYITHVYVCMCLSVCNLQTDQVVLMHLITNAHVCKYQYVYKYIYSHTKNK